MHSKMNSTEISCDQKKFWTTEILTPQNQVADGTDSSFFPS